MRVLVEQTVAEVRGWLSRLGLDDPKTGVLVDVLMGGDTDAPWDAQPERDAIVIGTQDMLLSRALQRGYGMNRYRWPIHFGLLNNDCQWVVDEVQLMDVGLATTAQLQAFRRKLGTLGPVRTLWMSATADAGWLATVDVDLAQDTPTVWPLDAGDLADERLARRYHATKPVRAALARADAPVELAAEVLAAHPGPGARTLVVVNTVARARALFDALAKKKPAAQLVLIHSRFRPQDRMDAVEKLLAPPGADGTICVATQVIEAGVDVSADVLFTELAPWPSLVQRFGRCNRRGENADARVLWIDLPQDKNGQPDTGKFAAPYDAADMLAGRNRMAVLGDAAPALLPAFAQPFAHKHVLRRADLLDLFDTTPDLLGNEIDVSRFVREVSDSDVQVFWRNSHAGPGAGSDEDARPDRQELCSVPIGELRDRIKNKFALFFWDALDGTWTKIQRESELRPGMQVRLEASEGGYSPLRGWDATIKSAVPVLAPGKCPMCGASAEPPESYDRDPASEVGVWISLRQHSDDVAAAAASLAGELALPDALQPMVAEAGRWHDAGKAHPVFQQSLLRGHGATAPSGFLAKSAGKNMRHARKGFRHELASALLALAHGRDDLVCYLVAAHHGKVRLSIRSIPGERPPADGGRFARGVHHGELVAGNGVAIDLGADVVIQPTRMDLSPMELGEVDGKPSWLARMLALRDRTDLGPFRLALLETVIRAADQRVSESYTAQAGPGAQCRKCKQPIAARSAMTATAPVGGR